MNQNYQITHNYGLDIKGIRSVYTNSMFLDGLSLFSDGDNDPVRWANFDAVELAKNDAGQQLPFDITVSFKALEFDRDKLMIEDLSRMKRNMNQLVCIHIVVFETQEDYEKYVRENNCLIQQGFLD